MSEENFNLKTKVTVSGSFTPKKAGKKAKVKTRTKAVRKPEKAEPLKALTVEGKKEESRPGTRTGKKEKKQKKRFSPPLPLSKFLPMSPEEVKARGWKELDVILVTGDAYVDHSSFGTAIIGRVLEDAGFRVGIIAQPRWENPEDFKKLGKPRLFFSVSAGNTDSMVSNLTPGLKPRNKDAYSPGGKTGLRPNRAAIIYSNRIKEAFPDMPIVLGGIEASMRRFAHYDYLSDKVRQSILADAPADLVVYGMGELQIVEIAKRLQAGEDIKGIRDISGTVWKMEVKAWKELKGKGKEKAGEQDESENATEEVAKDKSLDPAEFFKEYVEIPSFSEVSQDKAVFAKAFRTYFLEQNPVTGKGIVQPHPKTIIIQNKPMRPLTEAELDHVYELPYTGETHPSYTEPVPALEMVKFSLTTHRGCFGGCSFCAITQHQGRMIASRSIESILREAKKLTQKPDFKGIINGVGGPTANMYGMECRSWEKKGACLDKACLYPRVCPALDTSHKKLLELMHRLRELPGVRHVFTGYGVRYDLALEDEEYLEELCAHHISGQLRIAPEHFSGRVTDAMSKPGKEVYEKFADRFNAFNKKCGKEQYIVNYLMSGHPGCTLKDMIEMAEYVRDHGGYTEQVQDFTPTPMTVSTCMYYTGLDPFTGKKMYVARDKKEKAMQRALMHYRNPANYELVYEALEKAGRLDLVGNAHKCLIRRKERQRK
ncbi:Fe-S OXIDOREDUCTASE [Methanosarcina mazei WWM610]|nr:Fe-S oxidoreductase [Methanosarcina mazei Tuc01]AKB39023.1 Fe-S OXIDOREDUCTASE [Methanosarcina mazei WWM610]AKB69918.1 Fe-S OXIDOREDUCTASE [Methanosarcina mazei C16]UWJ21393.1 Fe-S OXIDOREDUCTASE [Methanosarcina mazei TMA]BBL66162.1 YgiQ family radical SAM protein [Methanosarcina mazei]